MNLRSLTVIVAGFIAFTQADEVDYDSVEPFPETEATMDEFSAALQFKPQLSIASGCHPYPAVDSVGDTNEGLRSVSLKICDGSSTGSQVYGRSTDYRGYLAIMYAWYFPRDRVVTGGQRHAWEHAIVWLKKNASEEENIEAVSASSWGKMYSSFTPPDADMLDGSSIKLVYDSKPPLKHYLNATTEAGDFQDLVMWDDMTDEARTTLNEYDWGKAEVPLNNENFHKRIKIAHLSLTVNKDRVAKFLSDVSVPFTGVDAGAILDAF